MENYNLRTLNLANYILTTHSTIRKTAKVFNMAKSTVHYDLHYRLKQIDSSLYIKVAEILNMNFKEKHIRGGEATRKKYLKN